MLPALIFKKITLFLCIKTLKLWENIAEYLKK